MKPNIKNTTNSKVTSYKDIERLRLDIAKKQFELENLKLELGKIVIKLGNMKNV
jgi:hypothetical protein